MSDELFHVCSVERQRAIAARYGITITGTLSPISTAPTPLSDEQVAEALRTVEAIPEDVP